VTAPIYRLPCLRWARPARLPDWRSSGTRPAQEARWAGVGKRVMSAPVSAKTSRAARRPQPGIDSACCSGSSCGASSRSITADRRVMSASMRSMRSSMASNRAAAGPSAASSPRPSPRGPRSSPTAGRLRPGSSETCSAGRCARCALDQRLRELLGDEAGEIRSHLRPGHATIGDDGTSAWLFPGGQPGRPISSYRLAERLREHGIYAGQARSTALFQLATDLPAAVLARLLGIHIRRRHLAASLRRRLGRLRRRSQPPHNGTPAHQIGNPASHAIPAPGLAPGKYARIERERRFLLAGLPPGERPADGRTIIDHYLTGTTLRLRCVLRPGGDQYKLTQKIPAAQPGPVQGLITNIYLSKAEHDQLAAALQGKRLAKTRYTIPPLSIDVFDPPLHGLITGEAEFGTDAEMLAFQPPGYIHAEITDDPRFTGGRLATTPREDLVFWLTQYGISPNDPDLIQHG
jgi:CYTH domain-containing protein